MKPTQYLVALAALAVPGSAIISGSDAGPLDFPSTVSLQSSGWFGDKHICAGTIIGPKTVLTAAYCCVGSTASSLKVRYGTKKHTSGGTVARVSKVTIHPSYSSSTRDHDLCVVNTADLFDLLIGPSAIALLSGVNDDAFEGLPLRIAGWGKTDESTSTLPTQLQIATLQGTSQSKCAAEWNSVHQLSTDQICAEPLEEENQTVSICHGDEGGPLMDEAGLTLVGVMSFNNPFKGTSGSGGHCSAVPLGNVFADVFNSRSWITGLTQ